MMDGYHVTKRTINVTMRMCGMVEILKGQMILGGKK